MNAYVAIPGATGYEVHRIEKSSLIAPVADQKVALQLVNLLNQSAVSATPSKPGPKPKHTAALAAGGVGLKKDGTPKAKPGRKAGTTAPKAALTAVPDAPPAAGMNAIATTSPVGITAAADEIKAGTDDDIKDASLEDQLADELMTGV